MDDNKSLGAAYRLLNSGTGAIHVYIELHNPCIAREFVFKCTKQLLSNIMTSPFVLIGGVSKSDNGPFHVL